MTDLIGSEPDYMTVSIQPALNFINTNIASKGRSDNRHYTPGAGQANFICAGQSNSANSGDLPYHTMVNAGSCVQINPFDGGVYFAADPLLGCGGTGSSVFTRMADYLITAGKYTRVGLIPCGIGATGALSWATTHFDYLLLAFRRAEALGWPIKAVLWAQGETDTSFGTTGANWLDWTMQTRAKCIAAGYDVPWMIAKSTYYQGSVSASIQAAVSGLWGTTGFPIGPDTDTLTGFTYRNNPDNVHFNTSGLIAAGTRWKDQIVAHL